MRYLSNIERAIDEVEQGLRSPLSISEIARKSGISFWYFQRLFAALVGEPIGSYIRRRRLTEAAVELRNTGRRVIDIALDFQFESHESFTRAFSATFHATPSEYRHTRLFIAGFARRKLSRDSLKHLSRQTAMKHSIIDLPELTLVGPQARFISALSADANNLTVIPALWHEMYSRKSEIGKPMDGYAYGAARCLPAGTRSREDELEYLAGLSVEPGSEAPKGLSKWTVPPHNYALFTHRGPIRRLSETINHIYGVWLPRSEFQPADGPEIERYDGRFNSGAETSEMEFLVPITRKTG